MAKKPQPPQPEPIVWGIYKVAAKAVWLGNVEAPDEAVDEHEAIQKEAEEFKLIGFPPSAH